MPPAAQGNSLGAFSDPQAKSAVSGNILTIPREMPDNVAVQVAEPGRRPPVAGHPAFSNRDGVFVAGGRAPPLSRRVSKRNCFTRAAFKKSCSTRPMAYAAAMIPDSSLSTRIRRPPSPIRSIRSCGGQARRNGRFWPAAPQLLPGRNFEANFIFPRLLGVQRRAAARCFSTITPLLVRSSDRMLKAALHGEALSGEEIAEITVSYLSQFCLGLPIVSWTSSIEPRSAAALAERCSSEHRFWRWPWPSKWEMTEDDIRTIGLACGLLHDWGMTRDFGEHSQCQPLLDPCGIRRGPEASAVHTRNAGADYRDSAPGSPDLFPSPRTARMAADIHGERRQAEDSSRREHSARRRYFQCADLPPALPPGVDSLRGRRVPRPKRPAEHAVDPHVVRNLLHVISLFPIGSYVVLNDTSMARVIRRNGNHFSAPIVQLVRRADGSRIDAADQTLIVDTAQDQRKIVRAMRTPGRQEISLLARCTASSANPNRLPGGSGDLLATRVSFRAQKDML